MKNNILNIIMILIGIAVIVTRFWPAREEALETMDYVKMAAAVFVIGYGLYAIFKKK